MIDSYLFLVIDNKIKEMKALMKGNAAAYFAKR